MIGENILIYLESRGIRQSWLAGEIGVSKQSLNQGLHGRRRLSLDEYVAICRALNVPFGEFGPEEDDVCDSKVEA